MKIVTFPKNRGYRQITDSPAPPMYGRYARFFYVAEKLRGGEGFWGGWFEYLYIDTDFSAKFEPFVGHTYAQET